MVYLTYQDRLVISRLYEGGASQATIAAALNVSQPTVSRELRRGATGMFDLYEKPEYDPQLGEERFGRAKRRAGRKVKPETA